MDVWVREDVVCACFYRLSCCKGPRADRDVSFGLDSFVGFLGFGQGWGIHECFHHRGTTGFFDGRVASLFVKLDGLLKEVVLVFEDDIYIWACTFGYPHRDRVEYRV